MATIHNLFRAAKKHLPMEELRKARIFADFGLEGCAHAKPATAPDRLCALHDRIVKV